VKVVKVAFDDELYNQLKSEVAIKHACQGIYGLPLESIALIVSAIENGEEEITIVPSKKKKGGKS